MLATPYLLLAAVAPAAFAMIVERWGYAAGEALLLGAGLLSVLSMEVMALWYRPPQPIGPGGAEIVHSGDNSAPPVARLHAPSIVDA